MNGIRKWERLNPEEQIRLSYLLKFYASPTLVCQRPWFYEEMINLGYSAKIRGSKEEQNERIKQNKKELIALAKSGAERPTRKTYLGNCLRDYTNKGHNSYDSVFDKEIRALRPDWFSRGSKEEQNERIKQNKKELIALAKSGAERPTRKTYLGNCLRGYINKGSMYDQVFDKEIRALRPDWFYKRKEK